MHYIIIQISLGTERLYNLLQVIKLVTDSNLDSSAPWVHALHHTVYCLSLKTTPYIYIFFLNKFILFILFLAVLGLRCCVQAFSSCGKRGLLFVAVCGLQQLWCMGSVVVWLAGSRAQAQQLWHMGFVALWHVGSSWTRDRTMSPALAGGFLTTAPTGKSPHHILIICLCLCYFLLESKFLKD